MSNRGYHALQLSKRDYTLSPLAVQNMTYVMSVILKEYLRTGVNEFTIPEVIALSGWGRTRVVQAMKKCWANGLLDMPYTGHFVIAILDEPQEEECEEVDILTMIEDSYGDTLFTEKDVCELTGYSRTKVRNVLDYYLKEGNIVKNNEGDRGRGNAAYYSVEKSE